VGIALGILAGFALLAMAGRAYQAGGLRRDRRIYPPPGWMVETPTARLHVYVQGEGGPVVWLEAGIAATCLSWSRIQRELATHTTSASYDRGGLGWSDAARAPRTIDHLLNELDSVVEQSGLPLPAVFVGHSFGGYLLRHYVTRYPQKVAALVLVDSMDPGEWWPATPESDWKLSRGVLMSHWGARLCRWGVVRLALDLLVSGSRLLPKLIARGVSTGRGAAFTERLVSEVRKLPPEVWPMVKAHWCVPKNFLGMADYLANLKQNSAQAPDDSALRDLPLWVISAGNSSPQTLEAHKALARASRQGVHVVAEACGHWVMLDQPELVVKIIREACTLKQNEL